MTHEELTATGRNIEPEAYARLARFVDALCYENRQINLTAIREPDAVWRLHICDALSLLPLVQELRVQNILDLGSGGGVPGVPLACTAADVEVTLLDSVGKKMLAAQRIVEQVGLSNVRTLVERAETLAHNPGHREKYDAVIARAVGPLAMLVEYAAGFVRRGGRCWFAKSLDALDKEIDEARRAAGACGLQYAGTHEYALPGEHGARVIVIYEKRGLLRKNLPRPPGSAKRKTL